LFLDIGELFSSPISISVFAVRNDYARLTEMIEAIFPGATICIGHSISFRKT